MGRSICPPQLSCQVNHRPQLPVAVLSTPCSRRLIKSDLGECHPTRLGPQCVGVGVCLCRKQLIVCARFFSPSGIDPVGFKQRNVSNFDSLSLGHLCVRLSPAQFFSHASPVRMLPTANSVCKRSGGWRCCELVHDDPPTQMIPSRPTVDKKKTQASVCATK